MTHRTDGSSHSTPRSQVHIDRKLVALGLFAGAAAGAWASGRVRSAATSQPTNDSLINWDQVRMIAINMNRGQALTRTERERLDSYYRELGQRCVPIVSEYTKSELPRSLDQTYAFDRVDWINANIDSFRLMFAPLEELNPNRGGNQSVAAALWGGLNQKMVSAELGFLLGYLARRVLGQYDLALLGKEPVTEGKLYYVEPNIRAVEQGLGLPAEEFRMWLALHETTHAFEFEAHPWVRNHFNHMLERYFEFLREDVGYLKQGMRGMRTLIERARANRNGNMNWIEAIMTPDQRALFHEMQATMCMVEGYSNHVMNAVGRTLLPNFDLISKKFELRQQQRNTASRIFARLTGLDVKLEQYRLGEAFIDDVVQKRGHDTIRRIWDGPENLPRMEEIRDPDAWLARVIDRSPAAVSSSAGD
ncbi:MAG: zinc-dependent metalloprotease [Thermomicrobiales bacterium]